MPRRAATEGNRDSRQSAWRDVNENIAELAGRLGEALADADGGWTFMCECGAPECREMLNVRLVVYREAHVQHRFLVASGHEASDDRVVVRAEDYVLVEPS